MEDEEIQNEEQDDNEYEDGEYKEEDFETLVTVFKTSDQGIAAVAESILEEAGIEYYVKGEGIQTLYGVGVIGLSGLSTEAEPVEFQVIQENAETAIDLLKDIENSKPVVDTEENNKESNPEDEK